MLGAFGFNRLTEGNVSNDTRRAYLTIISLSTINVRQTNTLSIRNVFASVIQYPIDCISIYRKETGMKKRIIFGSVILLLLTHTQIVYSTPLNLPESGDPVVTVGAEANCKEENPSNLDENTASCVSTPVKAEASLESAKIQVYSEGSGEPNYVSSQAGFVDLITVTDGWDSNGRTTITFDLRITGLFDVGSADNESEANFLITSWSNTDPTPPCIYDADDCGFFNGPYSYTEVWFDLFDGSISSDIYQAGSGNGQVLSSDPSNLQSTLSVEITVSQDQPSFYIAAMGFAGNFGSGVTDFYNTANATLNGPEGFSYTSTNGFGHSVNPPNPPGDDLVNISGNIETSERKGICAMVLANGKYMFSCNPNGPYSLSDLPRDDNGTVKRQIYVDGFFPNVTILDGSTTETITMQRAGQCPQYTATSSPTVDPGSAGKRVNISGMVLLQNTGSPVCAMVLANGQYMFSCDGTGSYNLDVPLDNNGQYKLQVYAEGFAPLTRKYDDSNLINNMQLARASECNE
jgi:hypothetical protein